VSHGWAATFDGHFDDGIVVFQNQQFGLAERFW
jgi:hypothetical protein